MFAPTDAVWRLSRRFAECNVTLPTESVVLDLHPRQAVHDPFADKLPQAATTSSTLRGRAPARATGPRPAQDQALPRADVRLLHIDPRSRRATLAGRILVDLMARQSLAHRTTQGKGRPTRGSAEWRCRSAVVSAVQRPNWPSAKGCRVTRPDIANVWFYAPTPLQLL